MKKPIFVSLSAVSVLAILLIGGAVSGYIETVSAEKRDAMEDRVRRLEDREEIRQLLMDYGKHLDNRNFLAFSQLFAERDGEWIGGMGKARGSQSIRKLMEETIGKDAGQPGPPNYHLFTNETIHLNGDRAAATAKWVFMVQGEATRPQPLYLGHYEDSLIRENGRWKFLRRTVHADIPTESAISKK